MKDRIRYSEAFKLKVMEELRDAKWKSVQEAARAYGIAEMSVYNWMNKLGFEQGGLHPVAGPSRAHRQSDGGL